jgi:hypothetical protein
VEAAVHTQLIRRSLAAALTTLLISVGPALALAPAGILEYEPSYFEGSQVVIQIPGAKSENPNQAHFACFALGPDLARARRAASAPPLYVVLAPGATQVACPDGTLRHDHVLSTIPGQADYTAVWRIVLATPGTAFDASNMPYTSVAAVLAGEAADELVLTDTGIDFVGPVVGGR